MTTIDITDRLDTQMDRLWNSDPLTPAETSQLRNDMDAALSTIQDERQELTDLVDRLEVTDYALREVLDWIRYQTWGGTDDRTWSALYRLSHLRSVVDPNGSLIDTRAVRDWTPERYAL